jgi:hypothetical protein
MMGHAYCLPTFCVCVPCQSACFSVPVGSQCACSKVVRLLTPLLSLLLLLLLSVRVHTTSCSTLPL